MKQSWYQDKHDEALAKAKGGIMEDELKEIEKLILKTPLKYSPYCKEHYIDTVGARITAKAILTLIRKREIEA